MKKALIVILTIVLIAASLGFCGWYFFLRQPVLKVEFYGNSDVVECLSGSGEYKIDDEVVLIAGDRIGYDFVSWLKDGKVVSTESTYTFTMSEETSGRYTAQYSVKEFQISGQGSAFSDLVTNAKYNEVVFVNVVVPNGFYIDEVYYVLEDSQEKIVIEKNNFKMPPSNISIFVSIKEIDYTITYNLQGGSFDGNKIESYTINTPTFVLPQPKLDGYVFTGYTDDENSTPVLEYQIQKGSSKDINVTANWVLTPLEIKSNVQGPGSLTIGSSAYYGDDVNFSFVAEKKYYLSEIYYIVDGTEEKVYIAENTFKMPNKPITVYAVFEIIQYSLNVHTQNGEVVLSKLKAAEGEEITVTVIPNEGYRLLRIYYTTEGSPINFDIDGRFVMPRKDVDIYAKFITDDNYIITIDNPSIISF